MPLQPQNCIIIHFDSCEASRFQNITEGTNLFGPWRTRICGHYKTCNSGKMFAQAIEQIATTPSSCGVTISQDSTPQIILLIHLTDLEQNVGGVDLKSWLQADNRRWIIGYSLRSTYDNYPACNDKESILQAFGNLLPSELWQERWAIWPWGHVNDSNPLSRALALLGLRERNYLNLAQLSEPPDSWHPILLKELKSGLDNVVAEADFVQEIVPWIEHGILVEWFDTENCRPRNARERCVQLLGWGDRLWVLEGYAITKRWRKTRDLCRNSLKALSTLFLDCHNVDKFDNDKKSDWMPVIQQIEQALIAAKE